MSLDVFVACATAVALPADLPPEGLWKRYEFKEAVWFASEHVEQSWQLIVSLEDATEFAPPAGKKHVIGLSLEGNSDNGFPFLEMTVNTIIKNCNGVLFDP